MSCTLQKAALHCKFAACVVIDNVSANICWQPNDRYIAKLIAQYTCIEINHLKTVDPARECIIRECSENIVEGIIYYICDRILNISEDYTITLRLNLDY